MSTTAPTQHDNLTLREVAEATLLDRLLADPATAELIVLRLDARAALVAAEAERLLAHLRKLGHLPTVTEL